MLAASDSANLLPAAGLGASLAVSRGKLSPPQMAFEAVLPRAAEVLLRTAVLAKLVTVCAPAGYGKTVILSRLHQSLLQRGQRCIWVTLDDRDVAVSSILYLVQAALADGVPGMMPASATPGGDDPRNGLDRMLHLLEQLDSRTTLFIDNLSFCTDSLLPLLLERLAFASPQNLRLVLSGTERLPLDATRVKLELGGVELQASHLMFDAECTSRLLTQAGVPQDAATVERVQQLTEGWPAAVRLVQILMAESPQASSVLARFSGDDHDVANVLTRRVLAGFDVALVTFLIEVALLREFSAELAEHVTGRSQAAEWIALLLRRNVLVFPIDRGRHWLRMHTLLRQYLLAEGKRRLPRERRREILERAAQWHADQDDEVAALEAALEAPSPMLAGRLLDRVARTVVGAQGRLSLYIRWVEQLLGSGVTLSLEAHTWYVWSLCFTLQYERAHRAMDALDHRLAEADPQGSIQSLQARLGLLRVIVATYLDIMDTALAEAERWLVHSARRDPLAVATVASAAATAALARDQQDLARQYARQAACAVVRTTSSYGQAWVPLVAACVELRGGEPLAAERLLAQARPLAVDALGEDASVVATIDFVQARALLELGRTEAARQKAIAGLVLAAHHGVCETAIQGLGACVGLWDGGDEGSFSPGVLEAVSRSYPPRVHRTLTVLQVQRLLLLGRVAEAQALSRRQLLQLPAGESGPDAQPDADWALEHVVGLQLLAGTGDVRIALDRCEALLRSPAMAGRTREQVQLHLLAAEIQVQAGQLRHAARQFTLAVAQAARAHLEQPFIERAPLLAHLLAQVSDRDLGLTQPQELALVAGLRERCTCAGPQPRAPAAPAAGSPAADAAMPVELLTARELQLLELLDQGLSNQQIADRAALTLPTVKWHFSNVYGKLQVKSRSAALARARALQLLHR